MVYVDGPDRRVAMLVFDLLRLHMFKWSHLAHGSHSPTSSCPGIPATVLTGVLGGSRRKAKKFSFVYGKWVVVCVREVEWVQGARTACLAKVELDEEQQHVHEDVHARPHTCSKQFRKFSELVQPEIRDVHAQSSFANRACDEACD